MGAPDYEQYVVDDLKPVVKEICSYVEPVRNWAEPEICAALHLYVSQKIPYQTRGSSPNRRTFRTPRETWRNGGNCEEQSVLLCSLYASVKNIDTKAVAVRSRYSDIEDHILPEVKFPFSDDSVCTILRDFYDTTMHYSGNIGKVRWENHSSGSYFIADPEYSNYIGDTDSLENKGYLCSKSGGSWEWNSVKNTYDLWKKR